MTVIKVLDQTLFDSIITMESVLHQRLIDILFNDYDKGYGNGMFRYGMKLSLWLKRVQRTMHTTAE